VSVFDVCVTGRITLISDSYSPTGTELGPGRDYTLGVDEFGDLKGIRLRWRETVSRLELVEEMLVFVISSRPADLGVLANSDFGA
jgi:hypothetical protein